MACKLKLIKFKITNSLLHPPNALLRGSLQRITFTESRFLLSVYNLKIFPSASLLSLRAAEICPVLLVGSVLMLAVNASLSVEAFIQKKNQMKKRQLVKTVHLFHLTWAGLLVMVRICSNQFSSFRCERFICGIVNCKKYKNILYFNQTKKLGLRFQSFSLWSSFDGQEQRADTKDSRPTTRNFIRL